MSTGTILDRIIEQKRREVAVLRASETSFGLRTDAKRPFITNLSRGSGLAVIAEVKRASPSRGDIVADFDPAAIARRYESGGAAAVSVLTDEQFFKGSLAYLRAVREVVSLPVLRKDFIVDPLQVRQTAAVNADAMLLIVAALSDAQLQELHSAAGELDLDVLIEVHDASELERALRVSPRLVGINNRNLKTFEIDLKVTLDLMPLIPAGVTVVSESGIFDTMQTGRLLRAGVQAVLVGESLMVASDPGVLIKELSHDGEGQSLRDHPVR